MTDELPDGWTFLGEGGRMYGRTDGQAYVDYVDISTVRWAYDCGGGRTIGFADARAAMAAADIACATGGEKTVATAGVVKLLPQEAKTSTTKALLPWRFTGLHGPAVVHPLASIVAMSSTKMYDSQNDPDKPPIYRGVGTMITFDVTEVVGDVGDPFLEVAVFEPIENVEQQLRERGGWST